MQNSLVFIGTQSQRGQQILAESQHGHIVSGEDQYIGVSDGEIFCTIRKVEKGWQAWFGEHESSVIHHTEQLCKDTAVQRFNGAEWSDYENSLFDRWENGDWTVREQIRNMLESMELCSAQDGYGIIIEVFSEESPPARAHIYEPSGKPIGTIRITNSKPTKESDIIVLEGEFTSDVKNKVVKWAGVVDDGLGNWELLIDVWGTWNDPSYTPI